jgi:hypothetical protein
MAYKIKNNNGKHTKNNRYCMLLSIKSIIQSSYSLSDAIRTDCEVLFELINRSGFSLSRKIMFKF